MKTTTLSADRIGRTGKEQLRWVLRVIETPWLDLTDGDRLNVRSELLLFSRTATPAPVRALHGPWEAYVLEVFRQAVDATVRHVPYEGWPRPHARETVATVWNEATRRIVKQTNHPSEIDTNAIWHLQELITSHGHLLKACQAPSKKRAGRKAKDAVQVVDGGLCGKWFVADKESGLYCSSACASRTLTRKKRKNRAEKAAKIRRRGAAKARK